MKQITRWFCKDSACSFELWTKKPHFNRIRNTFVDDDGDSNPKEYLIGVDASEVIRIAPALKTKVGKCRRVIIKVGDEV